MAFFNDYYYLKNFVDIIRFMSYYKSNITLIKKTLNLSGDEYGKNINRVRFAEATETAEANL
jgi:hypothetical protein